MSLLHQIADVMGGDVQGNRAIFPTPGHSAKDRGSWASIEPGAPDGLLVHCSNADGRTALEIKDLLRDRGILAPLKRRDDVIPWRPPVREVQVAPSHAVRLAAGQSVVATFEYFGSDGDLLYRKHRVEPGRERPKDFFYDHPDGKGGWLPKRGCEPVPYRLTDLIAAPRDVPMFMTEGEAKADRLASWGLLATSHKDWKSFEFSGYVKGRTVFILPDNDETGLRLAQSAFEAVERAEGKPHLIELPGLPTGGDILDWGGTAAELVALTKAAAAQQSPRPEPVDLWQHYGAPELPQGLLPESVERFVRSHADIMGVDPAGLAMATLCVCAATIPDSIKLQVKRHDPTWCESARLWVGLVGSPSMKKTPIMSAALRPLKRIDANLMRAFTEKRQQYDALTAKERKEADRPKQERRIISDATVEAAQEVLRDSPRGVLSAQDELSGWFGQMDKYAPGKGSQADRGFWLQAFNGGSYSLNRIARGASYIPNCSISLLGGIQPEPMRAIAGDTHDDGLVQRLLPVILRPGKVGRDVPADATLTDYERLIERLEVMRPPVRSGPIGYGDTPSPLKLSDAARSVRERLEQEHLDLVRALECVSPKLAAHFGKYDGLFARLCVLWHCVDNAEQLHPPAEVSGDTANCVAAFMEQFLRPSAIAFYAGILGLSAGHEQLVDLASWIVGTGVQEVKARDVQSSSQSFRHVTADEVRTLCEKLEAFGWGEWAEPAPKSNKPRFLVNPLVHERFADRGKEEIERRAAAREIIRSTLCR
ncbi:DUF3987 domain-containing protein [Altererythrobacter aerius]|uniref:DUF3987 domain-containing protein n=1 Tax=Tsuneonella aeria TaxID=1837929 RepID=A0A6I4TGY5_9SPHN|nr:DUF3987 domain-containing protein [Tsuneonella aeria]MXO75335.1 DUF3987 domain-containing protein [Tsuneonella aeria]